jgi:ferrochelatase
MNMGSPASARDTRAFLFRLFSDPDIFRFPGGSLSRPLFAGLISTLRAPRVRRRYQAIGGVSPLLEITKRQATGLENVLLDRGTPIPVEVCMRYSHPFSREAVGRLRQRGAKQIVGVPLYPQYSSTTTGSSLRALREALWAVCPEVPLREIKHWFDDAAYQTAVAERILTCLDNLRTTRKTGVLFLAHSIPERFQREGDPYIDQVRETVAGIAKLLRERGRGTVPWFLAYQGQVGPVRWVGPTVREGLQAMMCEDVLGAVVVPVSFVSDHLETLYEIDLEYRRLAFEVGMKTFVRIPPLNADGDFIRALADLIRSRLAFS